MLLLLFSGNLLMGQTLQRPRLVVGIVIDQMRYDYLEKFGRNFTDDGFRKIMNDGYSFRNTHYSYTPTYTGPGHATIYTGCTPDTHGIVLNDWYDRAEQRVIYCVEDHSTPPTGDAGSNQFCSPQYLLTHTLTDMLDEQTRGESKIISISFKDRSAILSGGHNADAAWWFDIETGNWITSSYYMKEVPEWVAQFNERRIPGDLINLSWSLLIPKTMYANQRADDNEFEEPFPGEKGTAFPHTLNGYTELRYKNLKYSPFGNSLTTLFALQAIQHEQLGSDTIPDLLAISYAATDEVGHKFGIESLEVEDIYLRLDREIGVLLKQLDQMVGVGNYSVFITSDHGASPTPSYEISEGREGGYFDPVKLQAELKKICKSKFGDALLIDTILDQQVYLNQIHIDKKHVKVGKLESTIVNAIRSREGVLDVFTKDEILTSSVDTGVISYVRKGFYQDRSGDIVYVLKPVWLERKKTGTTHGSHYDYDTHVPLLFYGKGVPSGYSDEYFPIVDITPTVCDLCNIPIPEKSVGRARTFDLRGR